MSYYHYTAINPLVNPVCADDVITAESGEKYIVRESINGYWIEHTDGAPITHPTGHNQISLCADLFTMLQNL